MENVISFYLLATKLKYIIRSGWDSKHWSVTSERIESIAEHIYGTCILAISMESEYNYDIDINKVIKMLVVHELEEVLIGDITPLDGISEEEKLRKGHLAIEKVLDPLLKKDEYIDLILEFDEHKTKESIFAYHCDKLEANIQAKYYQDTNSIPNMENLSIFNNERVTKVYKKGDTPFDIWYKNDHDKFIDDENFSNVHDYIKTKKLKK